MSEILKEKLEALAQSGQFFTIEWTRITDDAPTQVAVNGIVKRPEGLETYLWQTKAGKDRLTMRGTIVASDQRTDRRADGNTRENLSDAGAGGKWSYWTVPIEAISRLIARGIVTEY